MRTVIALSNGLELTKDSTNLPRNDYEEHPIPFQHNMVMEHPQPNRDQYMYTIHAYGMY